MSTPLPPPPPPPPAYVPVVPTPSAKPWWRRWWVIAIALVVVLGAIGAATGGGSKKNKTTTAATSTVIPATSLSTLRATTAQPTSTAVTTTTSTIPPTTHPPTTPPAPTIYSGRGDDVIDIVKPGGKGVAVIALTHSGTANFIVHGLDANNQQTDSLVNAIGSYKGTVLLDANTGDTNRLQVTADGAWTISIGTVDTARVFDTSSKGQGDDILVYLGKTGVAHLTHDGTSNFIVHSYTASRYAGLVNEIGGYDGKVPLSAGPAIIEIRADGNWTIDVA